VPLLTREGEVKIAKRIEHGEAAVLQALSRSPIVVQEMVALGEQLKAGERSIREVVVFNGDELTEGKIYEGLQTVVAAIDEMDRLYKRALQFQAKRESIPRTERPRDYRRYAVAEARHRILVSKLFRSIEFTDAERKRLIDRIRQCVEELKPVEREVNRLEKRLEGSRPTDHKDLRKELRQYRARLGEIEEENQSSVVALKRTLQTIFRGEMEAEAAKRELIEFRSLAWVRVNSGVALENKGDWDGAIAEYREAIRLNPNSDLAHTHLGFALWEKGDWDGAMAEYREVLRLNPHDDAAHNNLGAALWQKGDTDGAMAEYREALLLNSSVAAAHYNLGLALGRKGDQQGALEEFRAAYLLDPNEATYKQDYERLLQQVSK
jgi:tetratricopeptide (TPR) repeat protein